MPNRVPPLLFALCSSPLLAGASGPGVVERVSLGASGSQSNERSSVPAVSDDGRYVAFESLATDLVPGDTNFSRDVFVHDRSTGTTARVSVSSAGAQGDHNSSDPSISADGRFVAFVSRASNLVSGDANGQQDVFLHDRLLGETSRVSVCPSGSEADGASYDPAISADGAWIAFASSATNLTGPGQDTNGKADVFVMELATATTTLVSVTSSGVQGDGNSWRPALSQDGSLLAFDSVATNLVLGDTNGQSDVFVRDLVAGTTARVSVSSTGAEGNSYSQFPALSDDGLHVAFRSRAGTLVAGDDNFVDDVFLHARNTGQTTLVSVALDGGPGGSSSYEPAVSGDGNVVVFTSAASDLVPDDTNFRRDVFLRDVSAGTTYRVSVGDGGEESDGNSYQVDVSADGRFVVFDSEATNLVPGDTNGWSDVFASDEDSPRALVSSRNAAPNPASYAAGAPVLGALWTPSVDLTTTGHASAVLLGFSSPITLPLAGGQVLLTAGAHVFDLPLEPGPVASWQVTIPNQASLAGLAVATQAVHMGGVSPFALSNAQDICLGY